MNDYDSNINLWVSNLPVDMVQSDLGYPARSGPAIIRISDLLEYGSYVST